jgi:ATP/ADP translocase
LEAWQKSLFYVFVQVYGNLCTRILYNEAITQ